MFIYPFDFSWKLEAIIIGNTKTKVSLTNLTSVPRFLRFDVVQLFYDVGPKSIEEKCRSVENYLQPLKEALNDLTAVRFDGVIDRNAHSNFSDHSKLLDYLSEQLLKMFNSSREYDFTIFFHLEEEAEAEANVINLIIQMPEVCRCSHLRFHLWRVPWREPQPMLLPVDAISSWLNRSIGDGMNFIGRTPTAKEIFLQIYANSIENVVEMCDHLVEVCLFFYKALKMFT